MAKLYEYIAKALAGVAAGVLLFMLLSINFEVIMRYFFHRPTSWVVDFNEYSMAILPLLGGAWVLNQDGHVKVEIVITRLSHRIAKILNAITSLVGGAVYLVLFWFSLLATLDAFDKGTRFIKPVPVPVGIVYLALPIGFGMVCIGFVIRAWLFARGKQNLETTTEQQGGEEQLWMHG